MKKNRVKAWLKSEQSQLSNENGMFIILILLLVIGLGNLMFQALRSGFQGIMDTFVDSATTNAATVTDPLGSTDGSWNY